MAVASPIPLLAPVIAATLFPISDIAYYFHSQLVRQAVVTEEPAAINEA
jgi:hypothetical protein